MDGRAGDSHPCLNSHRTLPALAQRALTPFVCLRVAAAQWCLLASVCVYPVRTVCLATRVWSRVWWPRSTVLHIRLFFAKRLSQASDRRIARIRDRRGRQSHSHSRAAVSGSQPSRVSGHEADTGQRGCLRGPKKICLSFFNHYFTTKKVVSTRLCTCKQAVRCLCPLAPASVLPRSRVTNDTLLTTHTPVWPTSWGRWSRLSLRARACACEKAHQLRPSPKGDRNQHKGRRAVGRRATRRRAAARPPTSALGCAVRAFR